ncbi:MAG: SIMPL domain-containing protein [Pseudomonadota bacterium]
MSHLKILRIPATILAMSVLVPAACAQVPDSGAPAAERDIRSGGAHPNSIQPETTLSLSARASVSRAPDIAYITAGVETEAKTAGDALAENARRMNGVFGALGDAEIEEKDIQTSNFSISPNYDYSRDGPPRLIGYRASNQVRAKVTDLDNLGTTIDSLVEAGGNNLNGIQFGLEDDSNARDEARRKAVADAMARAELYADATGYDVVRIVSISEGGSMTVAPMPFLATRAEASFADAAPSPVSAGELDFSATVNVLFELSKE